MYVITEGDPEDCYFRIIEKDDLQDSDTMIFPFGFPTVKGAFDWLQRNYLIC